MDEPSFTPGETLAGKYEVVRPLGSGGMGHVYEGVHKALGKRVAIKVLRAEASQHPEYRQRFEREARAAASLRGPHVAQVTDVEILDDGRPFIVMEYLEGRDLNDELDIRGTFPVPEAVDYILQTCSAMSEAHGRGIVHRDLKPHNLYLTELGDGRRIKVLDFGISKVDEGDASVTATSVAMGTPLYMAPEQMRSAKHVDARADIWSLGVILYELLAGLPPFDGANPTAVIAAVTADTPPPLRSHRPDVPAELERVVMQMLEKRKELRPGSVLEVGQLLAPFSTAGFWEPNAPATSRTSAEFAVGTAPPAIVSAKSVDGISATAKHDTHASWSTQGGRQARRRRLTATAVMAAGALGVLGVVGAVWATREPTPEPRPPAPAKPAEPAPDVAEPEPDVAEPEPDEPPSPVPESSASASAAVPPPARKPVGPPVVRPPAPPPPPPPAPPPPPPPPSGNGNNPDLL